jgi:hypothetical protein
VDHIISQYSPIVQIILTLCFKLLLAMNANIIGRTDGTKQIGKKLDIE